MGKKEDNEPLSLYIQRNEPGWRKHEGPPKIYGAHDSTNRERDRARKWTYQKKATRTRLEKREKMRGTRAGKKRQEGKNKIFSPLNPAVRPVILPKESSVKESERLSVYWPSDRELSPLATGGNEQEGMIKMRPTLRLRGHPSLTILY
jgi:hypothetical protein